MNKSHTNKLEKKASYLIAIIKGDIDKINIISDSDWPGIIDLAKKNGIAQILYTSLQLHNIKAPKTAIYFMHRIHLESAAINIKLFNELEIILEAFEKADITVVPIKGAWLGEAVYNNIALRGMSDVDLWIKRNQLEKARQIMSELGYLILSRKERPQLLQDELLGETRMEKIGNIAIELHWNIFPGEWFRHTTNIDEEEIWNRTLPLKGEKIRQLSPEDAIIQICAHLAINHQMSLAGLRTLLDLHNIIQNFDIDWLSVRRKSKTWKVTTLTWLVLMMFDCLIGGNKVNLALAELKPNFIKQWILRRFVSPASIVKGVEISESPKRYLFLLLLVDKPLDAVRIAWRSLIPDRKWLILRYGLKSESRCRIWLQYLLHTARVILKRKI